MDIARARQIHLKALAVCKSVDKDKQVGAANTYCILAITQIKKLTNRSHAEELNRNILDAITTAMATVTYGR